MIPSLDLLACCAFGLEAVVARELEQLGYTPRIEQSGRVQFTGDLSAICRTNLWLRAADRVLVRLGAFGALDFGQLFDQTYTLPWENWIPADATFPVSGRSLKSQLSSVPACQKIVKKAIVERLKSGHSTDTLPETGPNYSIEVSLLKDQATLTLDTTGPSLHKRGYRTWIGKAPLKETMAAALVLLSYWKPDRQLIDPFCGTGTIPIEAALIGRNMAPGLRREFAADAWPIVPAPVWAEAREAARAAQLPDLPVRILGTDIDSHALSFARNHAELAGVGEQIHFQQKAFADLTSKKQYGCLIANPPYGQRLGEDAEVAALYREMPNVLRRLKTWSFYIFTAHPGFEQLVGQPADRRRKLYNGRIECTYFQFYGPKPNQRSRTAAADPAETAAIPEAETASEDARDFIEEPISLPEDFAPAPEVRASAPVEISIAAAQENAPATAATPPTPTQPVTPPITKKRPEQKPAFGGLNEKALEQAEIFRSRLTNRARHLRKWPQRGISCFRLYDRDVPEIPLVVDRYEEFLHLAEYERPHTRTPAEHADWLDLMVRTAGETLDVPVANIFLKQRRRQRGEQQYERYSEVGRTAIVQEGELKFLLNLSDYLDTGLFLDHRNTRSMVRQAAAGKRLLNLFCYTGSFTVYAAAGGAAHTTSVDTSNTYLDWAEENLRLNQLEGKPHRLVRSDAIEFLREHPPGAHYDLAVVDPPTFSNSKRTDEIWDVQRDHVELLQRVLRLMAPGGTVYFSTNFRRFRLAEGEFAPAAIREISRQTVPEDFRNERIHRCWRLVLPQSV